jgi:hypothetical protein
MARARQANPQANPFAPLIVPLTLLAGFLYVGWMGYSSEDPEPLHKALAFFFEFNFATVGAAVFVSAWAFYAVRINLSRPRLSPPGPFSSLSQALGRRLDLEPSQLGLADLPRVEEALSKNPVTKDDLPQAAGELGAFLGEVLIDEHGARWDRRDDPDLGPFAYQGSAVLLPQASGPPLRLNVFSVALRALQDPAELSRFRRELETVLATAGTA